MPGARAIAAAYNAALADGPLQPPRQRDGVSHVYHLYVTRSGQTATGSRRY